jgi:glycosyltransferase involved in cell wall biosynthesis
VNARDIRISVALVTRNRPESLARCLQSWREQSVQPFEIIVSDDSETEFAEKTRETALRFGCRYVEGPKRGLYANRNCASLACTGTHILSADDDHTHPSDYLERIQPLMICDPTRVWAFGEKHPGAKGPISLPGELHRSGAGTAPLDYSNCAAIADGASIYPREIFDRGLRYDESYPFGGLWYLWGKTLKKAGQRICVSEETFIWHHDELQNRREDRLSLAKQIAANTYAIFVNALWLERSPLLTFWAFYYLIRRIAFEDSIVHYKTRTRLPLPVVREMMAKIFRARETYLRISPSEPSNDRESLLHWQSSASRKVV